MGLANGLGLTQAIGEMHKILGQVALLGTPIAFGSNILAGLASFFAEPAKARNPEEFVRGVLRGSGILLKYATFGFFNAFSQVKSLEYHGRLPPRRCNESMILMPCFCKLLRASLALCLPHFCLQP